MIQEVGKLGLETNSGHIYVCNSVKKLYLSDSTIVEPAGLKFSI